MEGHVLRRFLYLDSDLLEDYLAGLGDAVVDELITETTRSSGGIEGGVGSKGLRGGGKRERTHATEIQRQVKATDAKKFQRLYATLEAEGGYAYWESMDEVSWDTLSRNQLVEAEVNLVQSTIGSLGSKLDGLIGLMRIVSPEEVNTETAEAVQGLGALSQLESDRGIPLRMDLVGSKKYKFVAHLSPSGMRVGREELNGEATVFVKVRRKFATNETMDLFDLTGGLESLTLNREQKRALKKKDIPAEYRNPVRSPAAVVIPIAIYQ